MANRTKGRHIALRVSHRP